MRFSEAQFESQSLPYIVSPTDGRDRGFLTSERLHPIAAILTARFLSAADESNVIDSADGKFGELAFAIIRDGDEATKRKLLDRLAAFLDADPKNALSLIKGLSGRSQGGDGVIRVSDFTADTYTSLSKLLDPERVFAQLRSIYGAALDKAEWEGSERDDSDVDRRIAEQFSAIHRCPAPETEEEEQIKD